ncbi:DUF4320 family protein [Hydrogenoanaerobacterium saccharovorans]|nr:DUF4320 family protein [Hydrogenoanaerobacterium saccharovorans]
MNRAFYKVINKLQSKNGSSEFIAAIIVFMGLSLFISGGISVWGQMSKRDDLQQIAQTMAREIALEGEVNSTIQRRLENVEQLMRMDVDMDVDGSYIGTSKKLRTESDFTVTISYHTKYGVGWINWRKEKTYVAKATGTVEEYHK